MAFEEFAVKTVCEWFESDAEHVVDVCAGPRREHWFNAEAFVALSHKSAVDSFVVYGEQSYATVLQGTRLLAAAADGKKLPDLVGFSGTDIDFIIEGKLILREDSQAKRMTALWELSEQIQRAKRYCNSSSVIGLIYLISSAGIHVEPEPFYKAVETDLDAVLNGLAWRWLRSPGGLQGLRLRTTSFAYPAMHLSIGIAGFGL